MNFSKFLNFKSILLGIGIFATLIAILGFSGKIPIFNSSSKQKIKGNVQVWGTMPSSAMTNFTSDYYKDTKGINIIYTEIPYKDFNRRLTSALADGFAPDLIITPIDITFANASRLFPVSPQTIPESNFRNTFVDSASILIEMPQGYLGLPVSVDPLVLYYNRDILSSNGFSDPPKTWGDLYKYEERITKIKGSNITMSTIALGTYDNIPHITDIILAMIFQQGEIPVSKTLSYDSMGNIIPQYFINVDNLDENTGISPLNSALAFTKDFADTQKPTYNWSARSSNAFSEFVSGNIAFYIGFASEAAYIKSVNQKLYFDYTYLPQVEGSQISATYANMYTISMLRVSSNQNLAYPLMVTLATGPFSQYLSDVIGGLSALKSNIAQNISSGDQGAEIFGNSVLISKTFYDLHRDKLESLMREAIRQVYNGEKSTVEASQIFKQNLQDIYDERIK